MADLKLFIFPGACSRVTLIALETISVPYDAEIINLMAGEHMKPAFQSVNPRGKVPALVVDGELLTENVAILNWLNETWPEAKLLPKVESAFANARQQSDLVWISSVWHPTVRANKRPSRWTLGDVEPVRARGKDLMNPLAKNLDQRLAKSTWYYGDDWSIVDAYLYWCYTTAEKGEYDLSRFGNIERHQSAIEDMPAFKSAITLENQLKKERGMS